MTTGMAHWIRSIDPVRTSLFIGAGAAHSSGAPLALELCRYLESDLAGGEAISDDLAELAGILENRTTRRQLVDCIVRQLGSLQPDGALIALAAYPWQSIYTTNYDCLMERAYVRAGQDLAVVRSHFDWENAHQPGVTPLFKIHGCITQDRALGHRASMVITAQDYTDATDYRNLLFGRLQLEMAGSSVWIVGYSLKDPDIRPVVDEALRLQRAAAAPGSIYLLTRQYDEDRAELWRSRGVRAVVQGDLQSFMHELALSHEPPTVAPTVEGQTVPLPHRLAPCTIDVARATSEPKPKRLFYGGAAQYADIRAGLTFERDVEPQLYEPTSLATVITGVAGTGKSTLARRLLHHLSSTDWAVFEHRPDLPLQDDLWVTYERELAQNGQRAALLVDNCPPFQRPVNNLIRRLPKESALHLVLTAETSVWKVRQKDARLFRNATPVELSTLSGSEVRRLRHLVTTVNALRSLLQGEFLSQTPDAQEETLRRRCSSDMFVCLKALFSSDSLDDIILREYAAIDEAFQAVYRITAALEAAGALPHRQMVLRVSGLPASLIPSALDVLDGLVEESTTSGGPGVYQWHTRHEVIAALVSRYKYSDPSQRLALFEDVIETANPSFFVEVRTLREICNAELGIRALPNVDDRLRLYRLIINKMPDDRVARHRLIRELIDAQHYGDAEAELASTISDVGLDPPLQRYVVRLLILRSRSAGLLDEDRRAIVQAAKVDAELGMQKYGDNKYMYLVAADVAEEQYELTGDRASLEWAVDLLDQAYDRLLDPDLKQRSLRLSRMCPAQPSDQSD